LIVGEQTEKVNNKIAKNVFERQLAMPQPAFDPGLTQQYDGKLRRAINKDGTFNVRRPGASTFDGNVYLALVRMQWRWFFASVLLVYVLANLVFGSVYTAIGLEHLQGVEPDATGVRAFLQAFFFSAQTLTTVGYGHMAPKGLLMSAVAAFEAMLGIMLFALVCGVFYGRVARPSARIRFSANAIVAPFQGSTGLQFRMMNGRSNVLMQLSVNVILMTVEDVAGQRKRQYKELPLERNRVYFFPLTWTVVHPINEESPLFGRTEADLERLQAEVLILVEAFDETFSQTVHARYSYRHEEIVHGARFVPAFHFDEHGDMVISSDRLDEIEKLKTG
jgi:inward rectifier potassium channel